MNMSFSHQEVSSLVKRRNICWKSKYVEISPTTVENNERVSNKLISNLC